jgi:hypothetical protein
VAALGALAVMADTPHFYPLVLVAVVLPWLALPAHPSRPSALALCVGLVATTLVTHAVFFGEDRYHIVVTPTLCILAAAALRKPAHA